MKKKIIFIVGILIFIVLIITIVKLMFSSKSVLELTYKSNGGVPCRWEYTIEDEDIVEFVKDYVVEDLNSSERVGTPIYTNYVFRGKKAGKTKITFRYVSITDDTVYEEEILKVRVDKNKHISLYYQSIK